MVPNHLLHVDLFDIEVLWYPIMSEPQLLFYIGTKNVIIAAHNLKIPLRITISSSSYSIFARLKIFAQANLPLSKPEIKSSKLAHWLGANRQH